MSSLIYFIKYPCFRKRLAKSDYNNYINQKQFSIKKYLKYFWKYFNNSKNNNMFLQCLTLDT